MRVGRVTKMLYDDVSDHLDMFATSRAWNLEHDATNRRRGKEDKELAVGVWADVPDLFS